MGAGLPNITGSGVAYSSRTPNDPTGCFVVESHGSWNLAGGPGWSNELQLNLQASSSNTIYGSSETVTPLSLGAQFLIKY